jgi:hypothetical protein
MEGRRGLSRLPATESLCNPLISKKKYFPGQLPIALGNGMRENTPFYWPGGHEHPYRWVLIFAALAK